jgi:hypothetical protein
MEQSLLTILPNLSIGVISIGALVYIAREFLRHLDSRAVMHEQSMAERENQIREVEREIRTTVLDQLSQNTIVMNDTVKSHERLMLLLDKQK